MRKSLTHCILVTYAWRRNPRRRAATECVRSPLFPLRYRVAQANSKSQPDGFRATGGKGEGECVGVPLSRSLCWCPAVSPAPSAWSSPAAAASFPGTEPSSLRPLLYSDLDRGDGRGRGEGGRARFQTDVTYSESLRNASLCHLRLCFSTWFIFFMPFYHQIKVVKHGYVRRPVDNYLNREYEMELGSKSVVK